MTHFPVPSITAKPGGTAVVRIGPTVSICVPRTTIVMAGDTAAAPSRSGYMTFAPTMARPSDPIGAALLSSSPASDTNSDARSDLIEDLPSSASPAGRAFAHAPLVNGRLPADPPARFDLR